MASNLAYTYDRVNDMYTTTVNNAHRDFNSLMNMALDNGEVINIASDKGNVIMLSEFEFRSHLLTLEVEANPDFKQSLIDAMNEPREGCASLKDVWPDVFDSIYKTSPEGR